jgi:AraC family transcriptional regulator, transcriptional activator of pobA
MMTIPIRKIKKPEVEVEFPEGFSIRSISEILKGTDLQHDLHRHDFYFILAVENGSGVHEIDFTPYNVTDHSVFFLRPGQVHQLSLSSNSKGFIMEFTPEFYHPKDSQATQLLSRVSSKNICRLDIKKPKKPFSILENIHEEFRDKQEGYQESIKAHLRILFIELMRHRQSAAEPDAKTVSYEQEKLEKLIRLIEKDLSLNKQVPYYAAQLNLSPYQLNAITKTTLGKTCSEVINDHIILEAKRHLLATSNQVTQIAYHLGYEDVSYFIRFFKKHTGHSPDAFRQNFR